MSIFLDNQRGNLAYFIAPPLYLGMCLVMGGGLFISQMTPLDLLNGAGLGVLNGLLLSAPLLAIGWGMTWLSWSWALIIWMGLGCIWGVGQAASMNTLTRLQGEYMLLAWAALIVQTLLGVMVGVALALIQPINRRVDLLTPKQTKDPQTEDLKVGEFKGEVKGEVKGERQWILGPGLLLSTRSRVCLSVLSVCASITAFWIDSHYLLDLYPSFHLSLRGLGLLSLSWGLIISGLCARLFSSLLTACAPLILILIPVITLQDDSDELLAHLQSQYITQTALEQARTITDWDQDQYSSLFGGGDCKPWDSLIHPGAAEIPENGIDDNCRAGDLKSRANTFVRQPMPTSSSPTNIVLITVDTTRPDHLGCYGYKRDTSPNIDAWAKTATLFNRAYSASAWTSLAMSSLMRGLYPSKIEWTRVYETSRYRLLRVEETHHLKGSERIRLSFTMPLDDPRETLAQTLKERGLYTMAVVDDGYGEFLSPKMGLKRGFDQFKLVDRLPRSQRTDKGAVDLALKVLNDRPKDQPFFLWLHLFGPHDPNHKHKDFPVYGKTLKDRYDHELNYMDAQVGRLLHTLEEIEQELPVTIVFTSDHGELFGKRRRYHGVDLHEQLIRIPLIISGPRWPKNKKVDLLSSLVDISPSLLASTQTPLPHSMDGEDLKTLIDRSPSAQRVHLAETWHISKRGTFTRDLVAAFDGVWKVVYERTKRITKLVKQSEMRRPSKVWSRDIPEAQHLLETLDYYLEAYSNDRGASDKRPPAHTLKKKKRAKKKRAKKKRAKKKRAKKKKQAKKKRAKKTRAKKKKTPKKKSGESPQTPL